MSDWRPGQPLEIGTARFALRSLGRETINQDLLSWLTDPELMYYLGGAAPLADLEALAAAVERNDNRSRFLLGIFAPALIGCFWIEVNPRHRSAVTHHVLGDSDWWGKGVPLECRAAILDWLFAVGTEIVEGRPYLACWRAVAGYIRQGWGCDGPATLASRHRDGSRHDTLRFWMTAPRWAAHKREAEAGKG